MSPAPPVGADNILALVLEQRSAEALRRATPIDESVRDEFQVVLAYVIQELLRRKETALADEVRDVLLERHA